MSPSRRNFLKNGALGAIAAGVSLGITEKSFGAIGSAPSQSRLPDMAEFKAQLKTDFLIGPTKVRVRLTDVSNLGSKGKGAKKREAFSLRFRGGQRPLLRQETYVIEHDKLGSFALLVVPVGSNDENSQHYEAVINRLHG